MGMVAVRILPRIDARYPGGAGGSTAGIGEIGLQDMAGTGCEGPAARRAPGHTRRSAGRACHCRCACRQRRQVSASCREDGQRVDRIGTAPQPDVARIEADHHRAVIDISDVERLFAFAGPCPDSVTVTAPDRSVVDGPPPLTTGAPSVPSTGTRGRRNPAGTPSATRLPRQGPTRTQHRHGADTSCSMGRASFLACLAIGAA